MPRILSSRTLPPIKLDPEMRAWMRRCVSAGALMFAATLAVAATVPDYKVGELAKEEVVTPVRVVIVDPVQTEELRRQTIARVPVVYRFCTNSAIEAEARFRKEFEAARTNFLSRLEADFGRDVLSAPSLRTEKFAHLVAEFHQANQAFPLNTNLFRAWAKGGAEDSFEEGWAAMLRAQTTRYVRDETWPESAKLGPAHVLLLAVGGTNSPLPASPAGLVGTNVHRTNILALSKVRRELLGQFSKDQRSTAEFLARFLAPNCFFAEELTQRSRALRTDPLLVAAEYQPGEVMLKAGQLVDKKAKAALDQLRAQVALGQISAPAPAAPPATPEAGLPGHWLLAGALGVLAVMGFFWWRLNRVKRAMTLLPVPISQTRGLSAGGPRTTELAPADQAEAALWRERALAAERRAEHATQAVKAGLLPHIARWLGDRVVRGLLTQRSEMAAVQAQAARDIEELEGRLVRLHAPLNDRLRAYEQRIAELEQQLAVESAKNRVLLQARIGLIRQKLQAEQAQQQAELN